MFHHTSRYYNLDTTTATTAAGRTVAYVRRRIIPPATSMPMLAEIQVAQAERVDLIANRTLGDPLAFWRICDANTVTSPQALERTGRTVRIPVPQA